MSKLLRAYYNKHARKLLADYVRGNPRVVSAIEHAVGSIPTDASHVLDIGCGIGWSSWEVTRHLPEVEVLGVDLSAEAVRMAGQLFLDPRLEFVTADILTDTEVLRREYDFVVMLDVYEHIPHDRRSELHQVLSEHMAADGRLFLSFPTVAHQDYLRKNHPEGLQPVDEDVARCDLEKLASDLGADLSNYKTVSIWHPDDYGYALIEREPAFSQDRLSLVELEQEEIRSQRVVKSLEVEVLSNEVLLARRGGTKIYVATPFANVSSETFIGAHLERLPADVAILYNGTPPTLMNDGVSITLSFTIRRHLEWSVRRRLSNLVWDDWQRESLVKVLRRADAVLAEYGPMSVSLMKACNEARVPLIAHFHGYDAYRFGTLDSAGEQYPELFASAAAIVAVSHAMEEQLVRLGADRAKLHYNPCGVDIDLFVRSDPSAASQTFLAVGRFVDKKGPDLTLMAFEQVVQQFPEAHLVMIGDGPLLDVCQRLALALGLKENLTFIGACSHYEVATLMQGARCFVQHSLVPSSGDSEGTPVAILEAQASGLPVVSTRHAGIPEVVLEGETGFLVDEGDVDGMAAAMIQMAANPQLARELGWAGRERVEENFSMEQSIRNLWRIVEGCIKDG